jgi:hypothetical protein
MLAKDLFVGLSNFHCKFLSFYFIWHNLMLYLFNINLFQMMHLSWLLFYFGNVFNPSNHFESSIFTIYHLVTTKFQFYFVFAFVIYTIFILSSWPFFYFEFFFKCCWVFCIHILSLGDHQGLLLFHFKSTQFWYHLFESSFILKFLSNVFESFVFTLYHPVTIRY